MFYKMGHRQQMNDSDRLKWDIESYERRKVANKGHNYSYLSDDLHNELIDKGYKRHTFINGTVETYSENAAIGDVLEFRRSGYYARIVCVSNKLRIKCFSIYYKKKK